MGEGLSFNLLGPLEVLRDGLPIELTRRKERQLLVALLLRLNDVVSTDALIESLWGDEAPAKPLPSLRASVSNLRKLLATGSGAAIDAERGGYVLRADADTLDRVRFDGLVARAQGLLDPDGRERDDALAGELLDQALGLVRGQPLADMAYDEFALRDIDRMSEAILSANELRLQLAIDHGHEERSLTSLTELVAQYPLREKLRALHMTALYRLGRQADALQSYQTHRATMIDDLGIDPAPELQRLEAQILQQDPALGRSEHSTPTAPALRRSVPTSRAFVGRERQLAVLAQLADVGSGTAYVVADAGTGKSALLDRFSQDLEASGWRTVRTTCAEDDGAPPLWPWRRVFRDLGLVGQMSFTAEDDVSQFDLFEELSAVLLRAAATEPVAICLDDFHWADVESRKFTIRLARQLQDASLLLVVAGRDIPNDFTSVDATWIELPPLDQTAIASLVEAIGERSCDERTARQILDRTGGNAYFVSELAKFAAQTAAFDAATDLPRHVQAMVHRRLDALPVDTSELLTVASLTRPSFSADELGLVLGRPVPEVDRSLGPALESGIIVADREAYGRLQFDHAITRDAVFGTPDPTWLARHHAAYGDAVRSLAPPSQPGLASRLSFHYCGGAPAGRAKEAVTWARAAAAESAQAWSYEEAAVHLRRALVAIEHLQPPDPTTRFEVTLELGQAANSYGDVETAKEALFGAFQQAEDIGDPSLLARAAIAAADGVGTPEGRAWWSPGIVAITALQKALRALPDEDSALRLNVLSLLGSDGTNVLEPDLQQRILDEAMAMSERIGDPQGIVQARRALRVATAWRWDHRDAVAFETESLSIVTEHGLTRELLPARNAVLASVLNQGDLRQLRALAAERAAEARLSGTLLSRFALLQVEMQLAQFRADWSRVDELVHAALDEVSGLGSHFAPHIRQQHQFAQTHQGLTDDLIANNRQMSRRSDRLTFPRAVFFGLALTGHGVEAEKFLEDLDITTPTPDRIGGRYGMALVCTGMSFLPNVPTDDLAPIVEFLEPAANQLVLALTGLGAIGLIGPVRYSLARGLTALGRFDEAERHIEAERPRMLSLEAKPHLLELDLAAALVVRDRDGLAAARGPLEQVGADAVDGGMKLLANLAERALSGEM